MGQGRGGWEGVGQGRGGRKMKGERGMKRGEEGR